jgi:hypothetical protein
MKPSDPTEEIIAAAAFGRSDPHLVEQSGKPLIP